MNSFTLKGWTFAGTQTLRVPELGSGCDTDAAELRHFKWTNLVMHYCVIIAELMDHMIMGDVLWSRNCAVVLSTASHGAEWFPSPDRKLFCITLNCFLLRVFPVRWSWFQPISWRVTSSRASWRMTLGEVWTTTIATGSTSDWSLLHSFSTKFKVHCYGNSVRNEFTAHFNRFLRSSPKSPHRCWMSCRLLMKVTRVPQQTRTSMYTVQVYLHVTYFKKTKKTKRNFFIINQLI